MPLKQSSAAPVFVNCASPMRCAVPLRDALCDELGRERRRRRTLARMQRQARARPGRPQPGATPIARLSLKGSPHHPHRVRVAIVCWQAMHTAVPLEQLASARRPTPYLAPRSARRRPPRERARSAIDRQSPSRVGTETAATARRVACAGTVRKITTLHTRWAGAYAALLALLLLSAENAEPSRKLHPF